METKIYLLENLGCAHCAAKMEEKIGEIPGISQAVITFATKQLRVTAEQPEEHLEEIRRICTSIESQVIVVERELHGGKISERKTEKKEGSGDLAVITMGAVLFLVGIFLSGKDLGSASILVFVAAYGILGGEILLEAARNIAKGQIFDENFLMCIATIGAFVIKEYPEAVGVMLFYRIGEYFEEKAKALTAL